ncbi:MAG: response regulator transcription factor [Xanthomonadaceae bacterium]|jgi:DNA-binding NarL/FixJ family response regulator|nr:response regulator transcription factor [Xanthomonadaceae bacterium]
MTLRVAIVEDQAAVRDTLVACLRDVDGIDVAWAANSLADARARLAAPTDVVLLDLGLPDGRGTALVPLLRQCVPPPAIVAFTVFGDEASVVEAIAAGVDGYVLKAASADVLVDAVRGAAAGESPISPAVAGYLLRRLRGTARDATPPPPVDPLLALTPRELDVLQALARGLSYREVAVQLGISPGTVAHHVKNLYPKLAAGSRSEAVFRAVQQGLITLGKP